MLSTQQAPVQGRPRSSRTDLRVQAPVTHPFRRRSRHCVDDDSAFRQQDFLPAVQQGQRHRGRESRQPERLQDRVPVGGSLAPGFVARHPGSLHSPASRREDRRRQENPQRVNDLPPVSPACGGSQPRSRCEGERRRPKLPGPAFRRQRQEQLDCLAGAPAGQPSRREGSESLRYGGRHHRPAGPRPAATGHHLPVRPQARRCPEDRRGLPANWPLR